MTDGGNGSSIDIRVSLQLSQSIYVNPLQSFCRAENFAEMRTYQRQKKKLVRWVVKVTCIYKKKTYQSLHFDLDRQLPLQSCTQQPALQQPIFH